MYEASKTPNDFCKVKAALQAVACRLESSVLPPTLVLLPDSAARSAPARGSLDPLYDCSARVTNVWTVYTRTAPCSTNGFLAQHVSVAC